MPRHVRVWGIVAGLLGALPCLAQPSPDPPADLDRLVADLGANDPWLRLEATSDLASGRLPLKDVERALARTDLSDEQRQRLLSVAASLFLTEPRAAMGISFTRVPGDTGTYIVRTEPGFEAATLLREDDRMDAIDGQRLRSADHGVAIIQSHDPGDTVEVEVFRNGQVLPIKLRLGSRDDLRGGGASPLTEQAWRIRSAAYTSAAPTVIECPVGEDAWAPPPRDERSRRAPGAAVVVAAGGEARARSDADLTLRGGGPRMVINAPPQPVQLGERELLNLFQQQRDEIARQYKNLIERERNANLNEPRRRELEVIKLQAEQELARLDEQIRQLTARLGGR